MTNMKGYRRAMLLAVSAVILLASAYRMASPILQERKVRSRIDEVFQSINFCKRLVTERLAVVPAPGTEVSPIVCDGGASSGVSISAFIQRMQVDGRGTISVALDYERLGALGPASNEIVVRPLMSDAKTIASWRCGASSDGTTVPSELLPAQCTR